MLTTNRTIIFKLKYNTDGLKKVVEILSKNNVILDRIFSRPTRQKTHYEIVVDLDRKTPQENVKMASQEFNTKNMSHKIYGDEKQAWFPRKLQDLDTFKENILMGGEELESDHPGFHDKDYVKRRKEISQIALSFLQGDKIPRIKYTKEELGVWKLVYNKLTNLYEKHACKQYNYIFPLLEQNCGFHENNIPQLEDISSFLKDATGTQIRPVAGLLSSRDFLNGLAFRVFHSTQYIRHHSKPFYTPEPDICHELLGHVPLFADPDFADFSQELGMASLGASDETIERLARCYWYTVEFGMCEEDGQKKAFGAGLLSSFGELEYCMTDKPVFKAFTPQEAGELPFPITTYQPVYFVAKSFESMKQQMRQYSQELKNDTAIRYNPYTCSMEILDSRRKLTNLSNSILGNMELLKQAIDKIDPNTMDYKEEIDPTEGK